MDFDGFLVQLRIEVESVERAAATLWEMAVPVDAGMVPDAPLAVAAADERCR